MAVIVPVIYVFVLFVVYLYYKFRVPARIKKMGDLMPGPEPLPFIGNALTFRVEYKDLYDTVYNLSRDHGPVCRGWCGPYLFVLLTDPDDIEVILSSPKHIEKGQSYKFLEALLGKGLITSCPQIWRPRRKLLLPAFHFKLLEQTLPIINKQAEILVEQLGRRAREASDLEIDVYPYVEKCSLDIVGESSMGLVLNTQTSTHVPYLEAFRTMACVTTLRIVQPWLQSDFILSLTPLGAKMRVASKCVKDTIQTSIHKRRQELTITDKNSTNTNSEIKKIGVNSNKKAAFLDLLLTQTDMDDTSVADELQTFTAAGHDTSTNAICACLYFLSRHQHVQDKLLEELSQLDGEVPLVTAELNKLKYLDCVVKESLRLLSPIPWISRIIREDVKLPSGYTLPAETNVGIFIQAVHLSEKLYKNPLSFNPDRFSDPDVKIHPFGFIPFSAGPRNCIGYKQGMLGVKIILAKILLKFLVLPPKNQKNLKSVFEISQTSDEGIPIILKPRQSFTIK